MIKAAVPPQKLKKLPNGWHFLKIFNARAAGISAKKSFLAGGADSPDLFFT